MKKTSFLIILLMLIICMLPFTSIAKEEDIDEGQFQVTVEYGIDGVYKYNKPMPIKINLVNNGKDFEGKVRVIIPEDYDMEGMAYDKNIIIASATSKNVSVNIPKPGSNGFIVLQILDDKNKIIYEKNISTTNYSSGQFAVAGILSDDYSALNYFDGTNIDTLYGTMYTKIIQLDENNIPDNMIGLEICDYIIINNYSTSKLSDEQYVAIKEWVSAGGVLILGTGPNYQKVLEKFNDNFVSGNIGKVYKMPLSLYLSGDEVTPLEVDALDIAVDNGETINYITDQEAFYRKKVGAGVVAVAKFDLGLEPISSWNEKNAFGKSILENIGTDGTLENIYNSSSSYYSDSYYFFDAIDGTSKAKSPSILLYLLIFAIYVLCVGPIIYIILKANDKREKLWIAIPILSVSFTIIVFLTSFLYRVNKPIINSVTFVNMSNGIVSEKVYGCLQVPESKETVIDFEKDYSGFSPLKNYNSYSMFSSYDSNSNNKFAYAINESETGIELTVLKEKAFTKRYFSVSNTYSDAEKDLQVNITADISGFTGTVVNNTGYDLSYVSVYLNGSYANVGSLKNGESKSITESESISYCSALANRVVPLDYNYSLFSGEDDRKIENLNNIYSAFCEEYIEYAPATECYVIGIADDYNVELSKGNSTVNYGEALIYTTKYIQIEGIADGNIENLSDYASNYNYIEWDNLDNMIYIDEAVVEYAFPESYKILQMLNSDYDESGDFGVDTYFYNYETKDYELVFADQNFMEADELSKYIDENNTLLAKYIKQDDFESYTPTLYIVSGGEE